MGGSFEVTVEEPRKGSKEDKHVEKIRKNSLDFDKDDWEAVVPDMDTGPAWETLSTGEKTKRVILGVSKFVGVFVFLYFFICSLTLLSSSFKLLAGKNTSALTNNQYAKNPIVGLIVGILLTVLVQSSSTSTSIIVSMVSAGMLSVHDAIPIIMGSNVGTSVTNTLVSLTQVADRKIFRRAFAGGTVHDMFNWLTVIVLLTVEVIFGMLEKLTGVVVKSLMGSSGGSVKILTVITDPFTNLIVMLDEEVMSCWASNQWKDMTSILQRYCKYTPITTTIAPNITSTAMSTISTIVTTMLPSNSSTTHMPMTTTNIAKVKCPKNHDIVYKEGMGVKDSCYYIFYNTTLLDQYVGAILLVVSLAMLASSLIGIVKLLSSMMQGSIATIINKTLNANVPYVPWLTGYIAILVGAVMTFIIQSSSIFTSTLTPIIGLGILSVERAYPLMLGSNIGTTTTALIAALASDKLGLQNAVQIALVHLFFNCIGICIWYPIPFMRVPIILCKILGNITAEYRWFAIVYLVGMFLVMPICVFALSVAGFKVMWGVIGPIIIIIVIVIIINIIQGKWPRFLPGFLKDWSFMPEPLRSLEPYDRMFLALPCCASCRDKLEDDDDLIEIVESRRPSHVSHGSLRRVSRLTMAKEGRRPSRMLEVPDQHSRKSSIASAASSHKQKDAHDSKAVEHQGHDNKAMEHEE